MAPFWISFDAILAIQNRVGFGNHFDGFLMDFGSIVAPFGSLLAPFGSLLAPFGSIQGVTSTNTMYFTLFSAVSDIQGTACAAGCRLRRRSGRASA